MSNSSLVSCTILSPNHSGKRMHKIDRITIHCVVGQCTVEALGNLFANPQRQASSNYGVGYDGRVGLYVDEANRSWCSSSPDNDHRAVTIEVASDTYHPYAVTDAAYNAAINLVADICKRNGINKLIWNPNSSEAQKYNPKDNEAIMTAHRWFSNTFCPGDYLLTRFGDITDKVNSILNAESINVGDWVTINKGAYPYGMSRPFSDVLWGVPHIVQQISGDRVVIWNDRYGIEAAYAKDLTKCDPPVSEPEPVSAPVLDPVEEPEPISEEPEPVIEDPVAEDPDPATEPEPTQEESIWDKISKTIEAIIEFLKRVFNHDD